MPRDHLTRSRLVSAIRSRLFADLGSECSVCQSTYQLEIDHPWGRSYKPHRLASYNRWLRYRREHEAGLVRLLCKDCNSRIRPMPRLPASLLPDPF